MLIISTRPVAAIIHALSAASILDAGVSASAAVEPAIVAAAVTTHTIVVPRDLPAMASFLIASRDPCPRLCCLAVHRRAHSNMSRRQKPRNGFDARLTHARGLQRCHGSTDRACRHPLGPVGPAVLGGAPRCGKPVVFQRQQLGAPSSMLFGQDRIAGVGRPELERGCCRMVGKYRTADGSRIEYQAAARHLPHL